MTNRLAVRALLLALALTLPAPRRAAAQTAATLLHNARLQLEDIQPDSAAALLGRVVDPRSNAGTAEQVRAWTLMGIAELMRGNVAGGRRAFRRALERDPSLRLDTLAYLHSDIRQAFAAERELVARPAAEPDSAPPLLLGVRVASDTTIIETTGRFVFDVLPRRRATIVASIAPASDVRVTPVWADTETISSSGTFGWDLRRRGAAAQPGRYTLRVTAVDSAGHAAAPITRTLVVSRLTTDTLDMPDPPDYGAPAVLRSRRLPVVAAGVALGAGAIAMTALAGNSSLNSGRSDGMRFVVAGAVSTAAIVGFLTGAPARTLPPSPARIAQLRAEHEQEVRDAAAENRRRLAAAPLRIRVEGAR